MNKAQLDAALQMVPKTAQNIVVGRKWSKHSGDCDFISFEHDGVLRGWEARPIREFVPGVGPRFQGKYRHIKRFDPT
jgi:hypothetical protein